MVDDDGKKGPDAIELASMDIFKLLDKHNFNQLNLYD